MVTMNHRKYLIIALILLAPILSAAQIVQSQQYSTTTVTTLATGIEVSTVTVGTQVLTTNKGQSMRVFAGPVTIPGTHGVCGEYVVQAFNGTVNEVFSGSITSNSNVNIYLLTDPAFQAWKHQIVAGGTCTPTSQVASQEATTSYNFTVTIPADGTYDLVVNNLSHSTVVAQVNAKLSTTAPTLITLVAYSTVTQQMVQTLMQTSVQTMQPTSSGPDPTTLAAIALVIVIIIVATYLAMTKRRKIGNK
ncbi:MAG TPA: hypothetical protein VEG61_06260 [Candidatus Dormibacteraeota bacterium]|nr:hypothetical protein [Candidatus Dormibacteraeota bacterium]